MIACIPSRDTPPSSTIYSPRVRLAVMVRVRATGRVMVRVQVRVMVRVVLTQVGGVRVKKKTGLGSWYSSVEYEYQLTV